jgi:hypothetical protein
MMGNPNLSQTLVERSRSFKEPYEFLFKINDNIIVQRFFTVNNYNPLSCFSMELKEAVDECTAIIQNEMKSRSLDFMDEFKYYFADDPNFDRNSNDDHYYFQVRVDGKTVIESSWSATIYPAKIRYDVNIKKYISRIISIIQNALSMPSRKLTTEFVVRNKKENIVYARYQLTPTDYATATPTTAKKA